MVKTNKELSTELEIIKETCFNEKSDIWKTLDEIQARLTSQPLEAEVKPDACDCWQKEKPNRPCLFVHRYNREDKKPTLQYAVIDIHTLVVTDTELNKFTSTMEEYADGEFFIIEYI